VTAGALLGEVARAQSGDALLALLAARLADRTLLTPTLITSALLSLARLSRQKAWVSDARVAALLAAAGAQAKDFEPRDAAQCVWALARLGASEPQCLPALLQAAQPEALQPRELSLLFWGLGSLRAAAGERRVFPRAATAAWLAAAWDALSRALPAFSAKDAGMLAFGLGSLAVAPPLGLKGAYERATAALLSLATPCELAHYLFGFSAWRADGAPSEQWSRQFWARATAEVAGGTFTPRELANLLRTSAVLGAPLQPTTLDALEAATGARIGEFAPRDLANVVWALSRLQRTPTEAWLDAFVAESRRRMSAFSSQELSVTLWALADLCHRPSDAWLAAFAAASLPRLAEASPQSLANMVWAFAVLDAPPPDAWMAAFAARTTHKAVLPVFTRQGLALCCWALAAMQAWRCAALPAAWQRLLSELAASGDAALDGDDVDDVADMRQLERYQIDLRTLHEVFTLAQAEAPGLLVPPATSVMEAARATWATETAAQAASSATRASRTYTEVAVCLRDTLALAPTEQVVCGASGRIVDLALERGGVRLALQVDGPGRFLRNTWQPSGATRLRDRALAAAGWRVLSLPFYTLDELRTPEPRAEYLRRRLTDATATAEGGVSDEATQQTQAA
jgi:hypothetical protein